jgi:DNA mismatch endonuclease, patch repair protein
MAGRLRTGPTTPQWQSSAGHGKMSAGYRGLRVRCLSSQASEGYLRYSALRCSGLWNDLRSEADPGWRSDPHWSGAQESCRVVAAPKITMDIVDRSTRSSMMAAVRQHGTKPERLVRRMAREVGLSYRLSNRDLPGSPDLANRRRRWAVFVNGCFWHGHKHCPKTKSTGAPRVPATNRAFWSGKIQTNRQRDGDRIRQLRLRGFRVLLIWECELERRQDEVMRRLLRLNAASCGAME